VLLKKNSLKYTYVSWILALALYSCQKATHVSPSVLPFPPPVGTPVTVTLEPQSAGQPIPANFLGFSYEVDALPDSGFLYSGNTVLLQLYKNLGSGMIRVGGNSSDEYSWLGQPRTAQTGKDMLTTSDVDRFAAFAHVTGWPVLFGLDLGDSNPGLAAAEAAYVSEDLGSSLWAFQIGNEPDLFHENGIRTSSYNYDAYQTQWNSYNDAVKAGLSTALFAGPDVADSRSWIDSFGTNEGAAVRMIDGHYYRTGPASSPSITYQTILAPDPNLGSYLQTLQNAAAVHHLGYRVSECNSVYDGGKAGVSNVFASALWALDFMWNVAEYRGLGINFHGGLTNAYSPIIQSGSTWLAQPEYYAMLAFKEGGQGSLIPVTLSSSNLNITAYGCVESQTEYLTLINKDSTDIAFSVAPGKQSQSVSVMRLIAPSYTSLADSVQWCNSQVKADGSYMPGSPEQYGGGSSFIVNVRAGSAVVVIIH
jgi:hypothetical protein